ncbi:unnamed protein product [Blepharisma stoltei]|uniref:Uncharacterized protein n=1 Tax=Blepharisma stoltei TaxID=1481888 RepID=A0AAU9JN61_9CILI|nr:unnamed protein product [Blepharisma stoltei]
MQNLDSLLENNSSDLSEIKVHSLINKTYSEASLKYLIPINPNEQPVSFTEMKFNPTCFSVNGHSISDRVSYNGHSISDRVSYNGRSISDRISYNSSKPNNDAQFNIDTSKNPDFAIYLLYVLTLNPFSPDTQVDSKFEYSDQYKSNLAQVGISQNTNSIFSPVITLPLINESVVAVYDVYDQDLKMTCSVYLQQISQYSFKFCGTFFKSKVWQLALMKFQDW